MNKLLDKKTLAKRYERIYFQLKELVKQTDDVIAHMATIVAVLHNKMPKYFWTGFYCLHKKKLIVGPYQGSLACQILEKDKGVCWECINRKNPIIVPDVHQFEGHIACDSRTNSEIVIPLFDKKDDVWAVLDIDSVKFNAFSEVDRDWLKEIVKLV
ncbi:MAG: GAF domain-containing protein [Candidatus Aminicenantaceae bacterium]